MKETFVKDGDTYTGCAFPFQEFQKEFFGKIIKKLNFILFLGVSENYGIFSVDGEKWRNQRRFALQVLRNFGMGRPIIENSVNI